MRWRGRVVSGPGPGPAGGRRCRRRGRRSGGGRTPGGRCAVHRLRRLGRNVFLQIVGDSLQGGAIPKDGTIDLFFPVGPNRGAQVIGRGHEEKFLLPVERHRPGGPAGADFEIFFEIVRHLVITQVDQADPVRFHRVVQHIVLLQHLQVIGEDSQNGALSRLIVGDSINQLLVRSFEVFDADKVILHQRRPQ